MDFLHRFFVGETDEILFFILVFLVAFCSNWLGKDHEVFETNDKTEILFFIVLFLTLFFGNALLDEK